jgi:hypothetical protein
MMGHTVAPSTPARPSRSAVQASLGRFGSFFGQQMRNATDSFNNKR